MKKITLVLSLATLLVVSCTKEEDTPEPTTTTTTTGSPGLNITDSMYLGSWYITNMVGNQYQNIGPDISNPFTYNNYSDCSTPSISNLPQQLEFRNDTMVFSNTSGYEWLYTTDGDTLYSGVGNIVQGGYYLKCN